MFVIYLIGYFITFFILLFCRHPVHTPLAEYLNRMGITTPFHCANGRFSSAMIQALFWPWVPFMIALILVLFPVIIVYMAIFHRNKFK